ncbi:hypothetical protein KC19_10G016600 [Ceratodon purpureus]|uniref:RING-type domain-containing protein n=1 Tax=Ceratodon purpureus TaxID=3225 RepID=A0A8T0GMN1_CERPU|nr:hypothetical protein KC19_10G016600 [Ceratodon purpureus]
MDGSGSAALSATMPSGEGCLDEACVSEVHMPAAVEVFVSAEVAKSGVGSSAANDAAAFDPVLGGSSCQVECPEEGHPEHGFEEKSKDLACGIASSVSVSVPALEGGTGHIYDSDVCAICLDRIKLAQTSQIKGCEHSYCITCILRWALYQKNTWCPQCRLPFTELYLYRSLDGRLNDYLVEESVCLLMRASWFKGMPAITLPEEPEDYYDEEDLDDYYLKPNIRIGNRRWGDNGYVRAGRREARPVAVKHLAAAVAQADEAGSSTFRPGKNKEKAPAKEATGRRAKRAQKREAAEKLDTPQRTVR